LLCASQWPAKVQKYLGQASRNRSIVSITKAAVQFSNSPNSRHWIHVFVVVSFFVSLLSSSSTPLCVSVCCWFELYGTALFLCLFLAFAYVVVFCYGCFSCRCCCCCCCSYCKHTHNLTKHRRQQAEIQQTASLCMQEILGSHLIANSAHGSQQEQQKQQRRRHLAKMASALPSCCPRHPLFGPSLKDLKSPGIKY